MSYTSFDRETGKPIIHLKFALTHESGKWRIAKFPETRAVNSMILEADFSKDIVSRDRPMTTVPPLTIKIVLNSR